MELKIRNELGIVILDLNGKIIMGEESFMVRNSVLGLLKEGQKSFLLNLVGVTTIDSSGVGELVSTRNEVISGGGRIAFFNPSKRVDEILKITKLNTVLDIYYSEMEAKASIT